MTLSCEESYIELAYMDIPAVTEYLRTNTSFEMCFPAIRNTKNTDLVATVREVCREEENSCMREKRRGFCKQEKEGGHAWRILTTSVVAIGRSYIYKQYVYIEAKQDPCSHVKPSKGKATPPLCLILLTTPLSMRSTRKFVH